MHSTTLCEYRITRRICVAWLLGWIFTTRHILTLKFSTNVPTKYHLPTPYGFQDIARDFKGQGQYSKVEGRPGVKYMEPSTSILSSCKYWSQDSSTSTLKNCKYKYFYFLLRTTQKTIITGSSFYI